MRYYGLFYQVLKSIIFNIRTPLFCLFLQKMWSAIATFCLRNRFWLLIALGIVTVVFGFYATKVKMTYDYAKVIPKDDPDFIEYIKFKETFGEDVNIFLIGVKSPNLLKLNFLDDWYQLSYKL